MGYVRTRGWLDVVDHGYGTVTWVRGEWTRQTGIERSGWRISNSSKHCSPSCSARPKIRSSPLKIYRSRFAIGIMADGKLYSQRTLYKLNTGTKYRDALMNTPTSPTTSSLLLLLPPILCKALSALELGYITWTKDSVSPEQSA